MDKTERSWILCRNIDQTRCFFFEIVVEEEPGDGGYFTYNPTILGCFSNEKNIEQAELDIREAIAQHHESLAAHGEGIPTFSEGRG